LTRNSFCSISFSETIATVGRVGLSALKVR